MPRWVQASVQLACAIVIVAGIAFTGYAFERYDHAGALVRNGCQPTQGVWFCIAGLFGNAC